MIILILSILSTGLIHYSFFITRKVVNMQYFMNAPNVDCEVLNNKYSSGLLNLAFIEWMEFGGVKYGEGLADTGYTEYLTQRGGH